MSSANLQPRPRRSPWLLETLAILLLILNVLLSAAVGARASRSGAELLGRMSAPAIIALIVVGIGSVFKGGRSRRARAIIVLVTMFLVLLGNCGRLAEIARQSSSSGEAPTTQAPAGENARGRPTRG